MSPLHLTAPVAHGLDVEFGAPRLTWRQLTSTKTPSSERMRFKSVCVRYLAISVWRICSVMFFSLVSPVWQRGARVCLTISEKLARWNHTIVANVLCSWRSWVFFFFGWYTSFLWDASTCSEQWSTQWSIGRLVLPCVGNLVFFQIRPPPQMFAGQEMYMQKCCLAVKDADLEKFIFSYLSHLLLGLNGAISESLVILISLCKLPHKRKVKQYRCPGVKADAAALLSQVQRCTHVWNEIKYVFNCEHCLDWIGHAH